MYSRNYNSDNRSNNRSNNRTNNNRRNSNRRQKTEYINPQKYIRKADISVVEEKQIVSDKHFEMFSLNSKILQNLKKKGLVNPTPIQEQTIPHILSGKDVIGIANTGTGKTGAFLLPLIHKLNTNYNESAIVITPTRELALQIIQEFHIFAKDMGIQAALCIGGTNIRGQEKELRQNVRLVVGTPGRLKDFLNRRVLNLKRFSYVVLDEVDRMVDIGFIKDVRYLISFLPQQRQSLFFSATINDKVKEILNEFVKNPVTISVKKEETASAIDQDVVMVKDQFDKVRVLQNLLQKADFNKVLVFGRTKWGIEKLYKELTRNGFKTAAIHGNKSQGQRQRALEMFKENRIQVLLATDVASRGLDIDNVSHVINFDVPDSYDSYIHRIGRTGRANNKGTALTFIQDKR